jgi:hypothetical protein
MGSHLTLLWELSKTHKYMGYAVAKLVEALRYKPEGRGFDWNFSLT